MDTEKKEDKKKLHGAVDESSSEQQFHKSDTIPLLCEKSGAILLVLVDLTAGWQAVRQRFEL